MHGRLKVKTSAQQAAEKKAARNEKLKIYQGAMGAILERREIHDKAQLKMTSGLLQANPDINTLWNIRKEAVQHLISQSDDDTTKIDLLRHEMDISQECLLSNPKSYGAWHHRSWCLQQMTNPDWSRELNLCNKYLSMDERNFHCWDHRRFVVASSGISPKDELDYSTERINVNFSNYSAWHYRSKLLPQVFPASDDSQQSSGLMSETKRREELDLVQNAAFTDPDDSSAWYYHKWLLLGGKSQENSAKTRPTFLALDKEKNLLKLAVSQPIDANKDCDLICDGMRVDLGSSLWKPAVPEEPTDTLWILQGVDALTKADNILVKFNDEIGEISVTKESCVTFNKTSIHLRPEDKTIKVLEDELANCSELLELEPESKWTRYAKILIMSALDTEKYSKEILDEFSNLSRLDPKRGSYYDDMRSKNILGRRLNDFDPFLDLSGQDLTCIYFKERLALAETIDLSRNRLKSVDSSLPYLTDCRQLNLDENPVEAIEGLQLATRLAQVSIRKTPLSENVSRLEELKQAFPSINFVAE